MNKFINVIKKLKPNKIKFWEFKNSYDQQENIKCTILLKQDNKNIYVMDNVDPKMFDEFYFILNNLDYVECVKNSVDNLANSYEFNVNVDDLERLFIALSKCVNKWM